MKRATINIDLILLFDDNPRLNTSFGEKESVFNMIKEQGDSYISRGRYC